MARVSANDPNLFQVTVSEGSGRGGKFASCLNDNHAGCRDGYLCYAESRHVVICACKCHAGHGPSGWLGLIHARPVA